MSRGPIEYGRTSNCREIIRRGSLDGSDEKDVATGSFVGGGEAALIGTHKPTIPKQHFCSEVYDVSSIIVHGMSRAMDVSEVIRYWRDGDSDEGSKPPEDATDIDPRQGIINDFIFRT
jgi:hypothetical protein